MDDLERAIKFYRDVLGFSFGPTWRGFYAIGERDGFAVHLKCAPKTSEDRVHRRQHEHLTSHGGGTIPFLAGRIEAFYDQKARGPNGFAPDGIETEFRRLYYDTANATHPAAMAALTKLVPTSQITYGTDYPYLALDQIANLQKLGLPAGDLEAIANGNATRLLPRLSS